MSEAVVDGWERALLAAEKVKERLRRETKALNGAGVPYAVIGGNAVAEWVARMDEEAVRNTRDVDLLVRHCTSPACWQQPASKVNRYSCSLRRNDSLRPTLSRCRALRNRRGRSISGRGVRRTGPNEAGVTPPD
jgi:hypothetical protein